MKTKSVAAFLCVIILTGNVISCSRQHASSDPVINVSSDDTEMNAAIAKARAALPDFWRVHDNPEHGESDFSLKVKVTDKESAEYFWVIDLERKDGKIFGTINNDAEEVHNVKLGDRITINESDIGDWLYMRYGKMVGNYTLRVLFKRMPEDEVEKYKQMLADP